MTVNWNGKQVKVQIAQALAETLEKAAFAIEGEAKINIRNDDLIDTGFMVNSVYAAGEGSNSYSNNSGTFTDKQGESVTRKSAPQVNPPAAGAVVAIGAEYAIYLEEDHHMLYRAAQSVAGKMGGIVKPIS